MINTFKVNTLALSLLQKMTALPITVGLHESTVFIAIKKDHCFCLRFCPSGMELNAKFW